MFCPLNGTRQAIEHVGLSSTIEPSLAKPSSSKSPIVPLFGLGKILLKSHARQDPPSMMNLRVSSLPQGVDLSLPQLAHLAPPQ
jgi:hypothetical protein